MRLKTPPPFDAVGIAAELVAIAWRLTNDAMGYLEGAEEENAGAGILTEAVGGAADCLDGIHASLLRLRYDHMGPTESWERSIAYQNAAVALHTMEAVDRSYVRGSIYTQDKGWVEDAEMAYADLRDYIEELAERWGVKG